MYKVKFLKPIKTTNELYLKVKQAYTDSNIPMPYPAANKQLQLRLTEFVSKGLPNKESTSFFDKVNSNRVYALEKEDDSMQLMMFMKEKDETKKLIVLHIDEEIQVIVSSFIHVFEQTGFIESAPKCHKRLHNKYAISNKRIRIVQRTLAKFIGSDVYNDVNKAVRDGQSENEDVGEENDENGDQQNENDENKDHQNEDDVNKNVNNNDANQYRNVLKTNQMCNDDKSPPAPSHSSVITRSRSKLNKNQNIESIKRTDVFEPDQKIKKSKAKHKHHPIDD